MFAEQTGHRYLASSTELNSIPVQAVKCFAYLRFQGQDNWLTILISILSNSFIPALTICIWLFKKKKNRTQKNNRAKPFWVEPYRTVNNNCVYMHFEFGLHLTLDWRASTGLSLCTSWIMGRVKPPPDSIYFVVGPHQLTFYITQSINKLVR